MDAAARTHKIMEGWSSGDDFGLFSSLDEVGDADNSLYSMPTRAFIQV
jgi:hypothetical protein